MGKRIHLWFVLMLNWYWYAKHARHSNCYQPASQVTLRWENNSQSCQLVLLLLLFEPQTSACGLMSFKFFFTASWNNFLSHWLFSIIIIILIIWPGLIIFPDHDVNSVLNRPFGLFFLFHNIFDQMQNKNCGYMLHIHATRDLVVKDSIIDWFFEIRKFRDQSKLYVEMKANQTYVLRSSLVWSLLIP